MSDTYCLGPETLEVLRDLWPVFGVRSHSDCLSACISLATLATQYADSSGIIHVRDGEKNIAITLRVGRPK